MQTRFLMLGPMFGQLLDPQRSSIMVPGGRSGQNCNIFEFLGGLVIYKSYQVQQTTYLKSFHFLCTYPRKVFSAWAAVWSMT